MNLLSIENMSKSYGEKTLLNNISLGINEGEKIGLIGINGTGKSTLLKVIAGIEVYDEGKIIKGNSVSIEYLPQNVDFDSEATVIEQIFKGNSEVMRLLREYENTIKEMELNPDDKSLQTKLMNLNNKMDALDAWEIESKAKTVLTKLGIDNFNAKVKTLSGGQKKRIALAGALISPSELLILDEPTNHIDNETINWLEKYLSDRKGALLMITHDRYFLDRVTNRILEIAHGNLYSYEGNYSTFLDAKVEREILNESLEQKRQNLLRRELAWIKRGAKARSTKQKARIDRFEELKNQEIVTKKENLDISLQGTRLGKKVIEIENVSKGYEDNILFKDLNCIITKKDRIGIVGPNGSGKSTLLNVLIGNIESDTGKVDIGVTVKIAYFSQEYDDMDHTLRVIDYIKEGAEFIKLADGTSISATRMLERFLFPPELQYTYISKLSGGEKRRLYLLRVLMTSPNVLILDEPTNDLDIETLNVLEDYIEGFNGAVIAVSHDRYFLDKICNKILAFNGLGDIREYTGNYSDYAESIEAGRESLSEDKKDKKIKGTPNDQNKNNKKKLKFSYNEQREYNEIDSIIEKTEEKLEEVNKKIETAGADYLILQDFLNEKDEIEKELEKLMDRWAYLNELAEKIENQD